MKNLDYRSLTEAFNKFRMEHQSKTYSRQEILRELNKLGFNIAIGNTLLARGFVPSERIGKTKFYSFGKEPIHKSQIESLYRDRNTKAYARKEKFKERTDEESAIVTLQAAGYQIRKVTGFDVDRFKVENPVLYKRYLIYETI